MKFLNKRPTIMCLAKKKLQWLVRLQKLHIKKIQWLVRLQQNVTWLVRLKQEVTVVGKIAARSYSGGQVFNICFRLV